MHSLWQHSLTGTSINTPTHSHLYGRSSVTFNPSNDIPCNLTLLSLPCRVLWFQTKETLKHSHGCLHAHTYTHTQFSWHTSLKKHKRLISLKAKSNSPSTSRHYVHTHTHTTAFYYYPWWVHTHTHIGTTMWNMLLAWEMLSPHSSNQEVHMAEEM